jgi:AcrR family transcriptional regulator
MTTQTPRRGRPRSAKVDQTAMRSALKLLQQVGFRQLTLDAVATDAGVSKMAIYRRWPNKAHVVMDAFMELVGPASHFPPARRALKRLKLQMRLQARLFSGHFGKLIRSLLGEAQFDDELAEAFRERWLLPRREMTREILQTAIAEGDLKRSIDLDQAIDLLYAPFYYRLLLGVGALDDGLSDRVFQAALAGLRNA